MRLGLLGTGAVEVIGGWVLDRTDEGRRLTDGQILGTLSEEVFSISLNAVDVQSTEGYVVEVLWEDLILNVIRLSV